MKLGLEGLKKPPSHITLAPLIGVLTGFLGMALRAGSCGLLRPGLGQDGLSEHDACGLAVALFLIAYLVLIGIAASAPTLKWTTPNAKDMLELPAPAKLQVRPALPAAHRGACLHPGRAPVAWACRPSGPRPS
jgi:hypothetical protein